MATVASGIITLTTDFGLSDPFVGIVKGVILGRFAEARIIDLTHGIPPQAIADAAFWLRGSFASFPAGTVHVAVVDPGVGTERVILGAEACGHLFLAPDNGLLGPVLEGCPGARCVRVEAPELLRAASRTFHGRDVFAPLAAELASGRARVDDLGPAYVPATPSVSAAPLVTPDRALGVVVTVDRFGNLITNLSRVLVERWPDPVVTLDGREVPLVRTYGDARPGELVALVDAFEVLEIACVNGDAAAALGRGRGTPVAVGARPLRPRQS